MTKRMAVVVCLSMVLAAPARAQHGGAQPAMRTVPAEARQYAFLVGEFELAVKPQVSTLVAKLHGVPKMIGTWKGWRALDGFGIEDELRITDESGNPKVLSHAVRYYDPEQHHWQSSTIDAYRGVFAMTTSEWRGNAMISTYHGTDADGKAYVTRGTYSDITPTSFRFRQERSSDEGKTWKENLSIEAKRVAATATR
ncbi:MAG: hypothetical protein ABIX19_03745 [Gemmatimonadaceae bacterium]